MQTHHWHLHSYLLNQGLTVVPNELITQLPYFLYIVSRSIIFSGLFFLMCISYLQTQYFLSYLSDCNPITVKLLSDRWDWGVPTSARTDPFLCLQRSLVSDSQFRNNISVSPQSCPATTATSQVNASVSIVSLHYLVKTAKSLLCS